MNDVPHRQITFGIMLPPAPPWSRMIEQAKLVESLGFDKLWLPDHFVNPDDRNMPWFDCWSVLSALANHTAAIRIGTLVSSMTLRNPAVLARMAMTVDHISGGRLELGVGAGGVPNCHTMTGVPRWERRERSQRYKEFVEILDRMLRQEWTTYEGKYYSIHDAQMRPGCLSSPRPTFNVAAHGDKALHLAAKYGDAWNSLMAGLDLTPKQTSDIVHEHCVKLCEFAVAAGRDPAHIGKTFLFGWTSDGLFGSMDAFYDAIGRYTEAGITDFCFIFGDEIPDGMQHMKEQFISTRELLHRIALEAVPSLRGIGQPAANA